jgi:hypothetical protein
VERTLLSVAFDLDLDLDLDLDFDFDLAFRRPPQSSATAQIVITSASTTPPTTKSSLITTHSLFIVELLFLWDVIPNPAPSRVRNLLFVVCHPEATAVSSLKSLSRAKPREPGRAARSVAFFATQYSRVWLASLCRPHPTPNAKTPSDHRSEGALASQVGYN